MNKKMPQDLTDCLVLRHFSVAATRRRRGKYTKQSSPRQPDSRRIRKDSALKAHENVNHGRLLARPWRTHTYSSRAGQNATTKELSAVCRQR